MPSTLRTESVICFQMVGCWHQYKIYDYVNREMYNDILMWFKVIFNYWHVYSLLKILVYHWLNSNNNHLCSTNFFFFSWENLLHNKTLTRMSRVQNMFAIFGLFWSCIGEPFSCGRCGSPYVVNKRSKTSLKNCQSRHRPMPYEIYDPITKKNLLICNFCCK